jgi:hypothetical protein
MLVSGSSVQRQGQNGATLERVPQAGLLCIYTLAAVFGLLFTAPEGVRAPRVLKSDAGTVVSSRHTGSGGLRFDEGLALALPEGAIDTFRPAPGAFVELAPVARPLLATAHALPLSRAPPLAG